MGPSFKAVLGTKAVPHGNVRSERRAPGLPARDVYPGRAPVSHGAMRPQRESRRRVASLNSRAFCCRLAPHPFTSTGKGKGELNQQQTTWARGGGPRWLEQVRGPGWANGPGAGPPGRGAGICKRCPVLGTRHVPRHVLA